MRLWIDCEWNGDGGELLSLALIDENGRQFYAAVRPTEEPDPWVAANVLPVLEAPGIPAPILCADTRELARYLCSHLTDYSAIHVVADWPEDIARFCQALIIGPGQRISTPPLTMEVNRGIDSTLSEVPHNALADARAMRLMHLEQEADPS